MGGRASRGFTLLELAVAVGIAVVLGYFLVRTAASILHWSSTQAQRNTEHAAMGELVDRLRAEEDSAWAIFTPDTDVNGVSNSDGHEVDFFTRDAKYQSYFWAYNYDPQRKTLSRYLYSAPGATATRDETYAGITNFYAKTYPLTGLQDPKSKIYSPLYNGATLQSGAVRFYGSTEPKIAGGNQITYVRIEGPTIIRELQLATQSAPSGFTVVLNYTPAPTPTTRAALSSWPKYIELPMSGQSLQTSGLQPPQDVAYYLNRMLGGAVANASLSPCLVNQARAFLDSGFSQIDANDHDPFGQGFTTDGSGCVSGPNGANAVMSEPGYTGAFTALNTCNTYVSTAYSPPSAQGPTVLLTSRGASAPTQSCAMTWTDQNTSNQLTSVSIEVSGCVNNGGNNYQLVGINATCGAAEPGWQSAPPDCSPGGSGGIQYIDKGLLVTGPGSGVDNGDGTFTVTRTGIGTITATLQYTEVMCSWSGRNSSGTKIVNASSNYSFAN